MAEEQPIKVETPSEPAPPPPAASEDKPKPVAEEPPKDVTEEKSVIPPPAPEDKPDDSKALAVVESNITFIISISIYVYILSFSIMLSKSCFSWEKKGLRKNLFLLFSEKGFYYNFLSQPFSDWSFSWFLWLPKIWNHKTVLSLKVCNFFIFFIFLSELFSPFLDLYMKFFEIFFLEIKGSKRKKKKKENKRNFYYSVEFVEKISTEIEGSGCFFILFVLFFLSFGFLV